MLSEWSKGSLYFRNVLSLHCGKLLQILKFLYIYFYEGRSPCNTSIYNTLVYIDDKGNLLGKHRKLVPTAGERLVYASGDGSTVISTESTEEQFPLLAVTI